MKAMYDAAPPEVHALCKAKAAEEHNTKAAELTLKAQATETPTNTQYAW